MITSNVYHRTFRIKYAESYGTCFTIDVEGKQYLITARHVVEGISGTATVEIFYENNWHALMVSVVGETDREADITVLSPSVQLSPLHPLPPKSNGIYFGQDIYFLGFPYNLFTDIGEANRNFPLPFVKKGIVSTISRNEHGMRRFFIDGHNNPGFSGGPVVWSEIGRNFGTVEYNVGAVISGYQTANEPVYDGDNPTTLAYRYNTGIIIAYDIDHAVELIDRNPTGLDIS
jgi:S1-C subfamily serine protease